MAWTRTASHLPGCCCTSAPLFTSSRTLSRRLPTPAPIAKTFCCFFSHRFFPPHTSCVGRLISLLSPVRYAVPTTAHYALREPNLPVHCRSPPGKPPSPQRPCVFETLDDASANLRGSPFHIHHRSTNPRPILLCSVAKRPATPVLHFLPRDDSGTPTPVVRLNLVPVPSLSPAETMAARVCTNSPIPKCAVAIQLRSLAFLSTLVVSG